MFENLEPSHVHWKSCRQEYSRWATLFPFVRYANHIFGFNKNNSFIFFLPQVLFHWFPLRFSSLHV